MTIERREGMIQAADGWELGYAAFVPPASIGTLLFLPAMAASYRSLEPFAAAVAERGITVVLGDPRGIGRSPPLPAPGLDFEMHDHLDYDWPAFISLARSLGGERKPLFLGGHSLGGQLSALYAGKNPQSVEGLVTIAACALSYRHWPLAKRPAIYAVYSAFNGLSLICGYLPGHRVGWGKPCAKSVTRTWSLWGRRGLYTNRDGSSAESCFQHFRGRALVLSFTDDLSYAPKPAVDGLSGRLTGAALTRWHKSPAELGVPDIGHFNWRQRPPVWSAVADWLKSQLEELGNADSAQTQ